ncbi:hypothetical protein [Burkholderia alba]|uniref:hypothetical protein n=1 Tax=Burkholderia alba TaxID=2683677 RepID=UPI002B06185E|nr:hypothetical protein [Burkholderia alba]
MSSREPKTADVADTDRDEVPSQDYRRAATALQTALVSAARERLGAHITQTVALGWPMRHHES